MSLINKIFFVLIATIVLSELALAVDVQITSDLAQTTVDDIVNIYVRVLDNSTPQNNTLVNFTSNLGNLSTASAYTNSSGIATVWINSTASGNATINASVGSVFNTTNVIYLAKKPTSIYVNITQNQPVVGNTTIVNLIPYDQYNNVNSTVNLTINITISDILGEILHQVNITGAPYTLMHLVANQSTVTFVNSTHNSSSVLLSINSTVAGNISLTANAENITSTVNITFTPAEIHRFSALYSKECTVNQTLEVIVNVLDIYDNPIKDAVVMFNASPPIDTKYNSPIEYNSLNLTPKIKITNQEGLASTLFRVDKRAGDNTINISVGNLYEIIMIRGVADNASDLLLNHTPDAVYANNKDAYSLTCQIIDQYFNPILPGSGAITKQILFTTSLGSTLIPLNESGSATTLVGPTPYIETVTVTATYKNETGFTNITDNTGLSFLTGNLSRFTIYANPNAVIISNLAGNHNSSLTIMAIDAWGHPIPGINVMLNNTNTSLGGVTVEGINATNLINASTDSDGRIQAVFTSKTIAGNATITAINGSINGSTIVEVKDQPFMSVNITIEPTSINSGDTVNVTTIISVEGELPITRPAARSMLVLDRSGSMDPDYYAGTPLDVVLVLDRSGSMKFLGTNPEQPMTDAKTAAKVFMDNLVSNSQVGVVSFSSSSRIDIGLTLLNSSDNKTLVRSEIDVILADGSTAMGDGMADANTMLVNGRDDARKIMIVLTDGVCNAGSDCAGSNAIAIANANGITIYTIGLGSSDYIDEPLLQHIASDTGGKYYNAPTSSELRGVYNAIAQEISDYDITQIEYGEEGFTPYNYEKPGSVDVVTYLLRFEGYDFDTTFDAGSNYGGSNAGECLIQVNGQNYALIPPPTGPNDDWVNDYEYDISSYVQNGSNIVRFYDYHEYLGLGSWISRVRNVDILENDVVIANYSTDTDLNGSGYSCVFDGNKTSIFEDTFLINETINDLKVQLDWKNTSSDLDLTLISPGGHVYGSGDDTTGYYFDDGGAVHMNTSGYIWIHPLPYTYPDTDLDTIEKGNWTVRVTGSGNGTELFNITTYIDKKSAAKIGSYAFISSFDESRGDRVGLVLYSSDSVGNSNIQTSYLRNRSTWVGYFEGDTPQKSYTLNFTGRDCDGSYNGYGECYIKMNGDYVTSMPPPNAPNNAVREYTVDITSFTQSGSNIVSFYDYHDIYGSDWDNDIKDVEIFENGGLIESYQPTWVDLKATPNNYMFNATFNITTFNLTWENPTDDLDLYLYKGADLVNYSNNTAGFEELSVLINSGYSYHVVVDGANITNETKFNLTVSQSLDWQQWYGTVTSTLNDSIAHLNNSIDTMTADGLTAIDEGVYEANNELSTVSGNSTIVLMTDGLDNSGYHSLMLEARRARDNNTVIYTIGFGNNESEVDPVLMEIANITGGKYYFAPNASILKSIFRGIAANITDFTAESPTLNLHIPHNYISGFSVATASYVANSTNATSGNFTNFTVPTYPNRSNAEPNMTTVGNETILTWELPNLNPLEKWGVWYQLTVEGAGYVPLILPTSNIGYVDVNGTNITLNITFLGGPNLGGSGVNVYYLALGSTQLSANPPIVLIGEPSNIIVTAKYVDGNPAIADVSLYTNLGYFNDSFLNIFNMTVSGSYVVDLASAKAGYANITAVGSNGNNTIWNNVVVVIRPKGMITIS